MDRRHIRPASIFLAILLFVAILPLNYGYYTFLRIAVTIISTMLAYYFYNHRSQKWIFFAAMMILWNPLIPVYLGKESWVPIDFITAIAVLVIGKPKDAIKDTLERRKNGDI